MSPAHRRYIAIEAGIGGAISAVLSVAFCGLVFGRQARVPIDGLHGLIVDAAPQTFMITLMAVLVPTILTRSRIRRGRLLPRVRGRQLRPAGALPRAFVAGAVATGIAVAVHCIILPLGAATWPLTGALLFKAIYGTALGCAIAAAASHAALADPPAPMARD